MLKALVHTVSPEIDRCKLTYLPRQSIDFRKMTAQHQAYCELLKAHGFDVVTMSRSIDQPDAAFVEDTAVVLDEVAIIANMGIPSRRTEVGAVEAELLKYRPVARVLAPATLEGGDVLVVGNTIFVGKSTRSNEAGQRALKHIVGRFDYTVVPVDVCDCLHLKTACTALSNRSVLVNPDWVNIDHFSDFNVITVDPDEPWAANTISLGDKILMHAGFPRTHAILQELNFNITTIDISEFLKVEAGLSCLSLLFESKTRPRISPKSSG